MLGTSLVAERLVASQEGLTSMELVASSKSVNWIRMAQDRAQRRGVLDMIMRLWVPYVAGNLLPR
jgi:hypothetical protein